jgi:hypothetical protein
MLKVFGKKGQGVTGEYVILIALTAMAVMTVLTYTRRAIQGRYRDGNRLIYMKAAGALGNAVMPEYEPYYVNTSAGMETTTLEEEKTAADGGMDKTDGLKRKTGSLSTQLPF